MKKILLTVITIFAINVMASAQMRFGIKGGLNLANVSFSTSGATVSPSSIIGFHGGLVLDASLSEKISIQPNLLFSQKGFSLSLAGTDNKASFNYIEIPVNFLYHITDALSVGAGPYLGYMLSGNTTSGGTTTSINFDTDKTKRLDFGLNVNVGYEVIDGLIVSANYGLGLSNIASDGTTTAKNNVLGFSVTKLFGEK